MDILEEKIVAQDRLIDTLVVAHEEACEKQRIAQACLITMSTTAAPATEMRAQADLCHRLQADRGASFRALDNAHEAMNALTIQRVNGARQ